MQRYHGSKIMTAKELAEQKREAQAVSDIVQATNRDPYDDENAQKRLLEEVNSMERSLLSDTDGNSEIWLNEKWKVFNTCTTIGSVEGGDVSLGGGTLSVARCYPMKNRVPDVLPFDNSRVELPTTKDDYINASYIRHLSPHSPNFIATQWPSSDLTLCSVISKECDETPPPEAAVVIFIGSFLVVGQ